MKLIFLDTETTGNEVGKDRLCEVCYKVVELAELEEDGELKCEYFKPPLPISVKSSSVTHITNKMVVDKQAFADSQMKKDLEGLLLADENDAGNVLIAHNAKFDVAMLEAEGLKVPRIICTLRTARYLDDNAVIPEYGLQYLRYFLELEVEAQAHDAAGDVKVLTEIFKRQFTKFKESGLSAEEVIEKMIEISARPSLIKKFNFGKHKDKTVAEVARVDRNYLEWLLKQKLETGEDDDDWVYTLKYYL